MYLLRTFRILYSVLAEKASTRQEYTKGRDLRSYFAKV